MPLYEYRCGECGHAFEKILKFSDNPEVDCPECGSVCKKLLSAPAVHFKGSGWYVTDYARKGKQDGATDKPAGAKNSKDSSKDKSGKEATVSEKTSGSSDSSPSKPDSGKNKD